MMSRQSRQSFSMLPTTRGSRTKLKVVAGRYYQIVPANLPPRSPQWLKSIRIVLVTDADKNNVTIKFPSKEAIEGCSFNKDKSGPDLDKCFIMGFKLAQRVLRREVEVPECNSVEEVKVFWMVRTLTTPKLEIDDIPLRDLRAMKREGLKEEMAMDEASKLAIVKVEVKEEIFNDEDDTRKIKKYKYWSNESFEAGKKVILRVLKDLNASLENPVFRIALRKEAQKDIGNTGLLDHLLKDIPGKVAPDGTSRFQRCYNADGVIMYWLESADLLDMRKKAGVADPFWVPPPNWKVGSCSSGCSCSKELEELKEELAKVKSDLANTQKQLDEVRASNEIRSSNEIRRCYDCSNWVGGFW